MLSKIARSLLIPRQNLRLIKKVNLQTSPNFTKDSYNVQRGRYNKLEERHVIFFRDLLDESGVVTDQSDLEKYNVDFLQRFRGCSSLVLKPKTAEQVSKILSFCNDNVLAVCPQGGHTGICGGATPIFDEIIISTERMNQIIGLDETSGVLICEAGCILENLHNYVQEKNHVMPLDLGSKGSCTIGGNVSTNAGGLRVFRYGNLHGNILGLQVVKANGDILDCLNTLKKDNTGFHLKNMFIGSEGCLGFVTKVVIQCPPKPKSVQLAFLGAQSYKNVLEAFKIAKQELGEIISAIEFMDHETIQMVEAHTDMSSPIGHFPVYLMIETAGSHETHDEEKLNKYFEYCMEKNVVADGLVTSSPGKREKLWAIREKLATLYKQEGYVFAYDLSLPLENYYDFVEEMRNYMGTKAHRVFSYGHLGDCSFHVQMSTKEFTKENLDYIEPHIFKRVKDINGSISTEHGVGFLKTKFLPLVKPESNLMLMRDLKKTMDPNYILNPYKII